MRANLRVHVAMEFVGEVGRIGDDVLVGHRLALVFHRPSLSAFVVRIHRVFIPLRDLLVGPGKAETQENSRDAHDTNLSIIYWE